MTTSTPVQRTGAALYLLTVWVGVTIYAHHAYGWGYPHAAAGSMIPAVVVGGLLILAVGAAVLPFAAVHFVWTEVRDRRADRKSGAG